MRDNRRRFVLACAILLGSAGEIPAQGRVRRVAVLGLDSEAKEVKDVVARLRELGYVEGRNLAMATGSSPERPGEFAQRAREMVRQGVDVIVACGVMAIIAARDATNTIPIVMV